MLFAEKCHEAWANGEKMCLSILYSFHSTFIRNNHKKIFKTRLNLCFRLYIEFQKDHATGRQEALIALMEVGDPMEVAELRTVLPDLLKTERESKETYHHYLKNALLSSVR